MNDDLAPILDRLRAAGEATRLRILALLRIRDLAVGELVQVLEQSQPRLSHHLKTLTSAGLVERLPEGSWVFYRAATRGPSGEFLASLFEQIDTRQQSFADDAARLQHVNADRAASAEAYFSNVAETWDTVRGLHSPNAAIETALLELAGPGPFKRMIDFGTGTGRMLNLFSSRVEDAEGIDLSHQMLTVARANLEREGAARARVRQGDVTATPFDDASADLITIHQVLHFMDAPGQAVAEAARVLAPGGRLLIVDFAPHDLEFLRVEHGHHRLGVHHEMLADWAKTAGLRVSQPRAIAPPPGATPGLTVHIWAADKSATAKEAAA